MKKYLLLSFFSLILVASFVFIKTVSAGVYPDQDYFATIDGLTVPGSCKVAKEVKSTNPCEGNLLNCLFAGPSTIAYGLNAAEGRPTSRPGNAHSVGGPSFCKQGQAQAVGCNHIYYMNNVAGPTRGTYCENKESLFPEKNYEQCVALWSGTGKEVYSDCCSDKAVSLFIGKSGASLPKDTCCRRGQKSCPVSVVFAVPSGFLIGHYDKVRISEPVTACAYKLEANAGNVTIPGIPGKFYTVDKNGILSGTKDGLYPEVVAPNAYCGDGKQHQLSSFSASGMFLRIRNLPMVALWAELGSPVTSVVPEDQRKGGLHYFSDAVQKVRNFLLSFVAATQDSYPLTFKKTAGSSCRFEVYDSSGAKKDTFLYYRNGYLFLRGMYKEEYQSMAADTVTYSKDPEIAKEATRLAYSDLMFNDKGYAFYWDGRAWKPSSFVDFLSPDYITAYNKIAEMAGAECNTDYAVTEPEAKKILNFVAPIIISATTTPDISFNSIALGSTMVKGQTYNVTWSSKNLATSTMITIALINGSQPVTGALKNPVYVPNSGSYDLNILSSVSNGDTYSLQASDGKGRVFGTSPVFKVRSATSTNATLTLLIDRSLSTVYTGRTYPLNWTSTGLPTTAQIRIWIQKGGADLPSYGSYQNGFSVPNSGHYDFTIPPILPDGSDYSLRFSVDGITLAATPRFAVSTAPTSATSAATPSLVISPVSIIQGQSAPLTWTSTGLSDKLILRLLNARNEVIFSTTIPNTGSYSRSLGSTPPGTYSIRLESEDGSVSATTNTFTVVAPNLGAAVFQLLLPWARID